jgi:hypothetical protein
MFKKFLFFSTIRNQPLFVKNKSKVVSFNKTNNHFFFILKNNNLLDFFTTKIAVKPQLNFLTFSDKFGFLLNKILLNTNKFKSLSTTFNVMEWFERESKEFDTFLFIDLKDSRSLLTPYSFNLKNDNFFLIKNNNCFFNCLYKRLYFFKKNKIKLTMLKVFLKLKSNYVFFKNLKASNKTLLFIFFFILNKNFSFFKFRVLSKRKLFTIIQSPFHYKNSKKNVENRYSFTEISFQSTNFKEGSEYLFILKKKIKLNFGFFNLKKIKLKK